VAASKLPLYAEALFTNTVQSGRQRDTAHTALPQQKPISGHSKQLWNAIGGMSHFRAVSGVSASHFQILHSVLTKTNSSHKVNNVDINMFTTEE